MDDCGSNGSHGEACACASGKSVASRMDSSDLCVSCILPRSIHGLGFDQAGVCDICNAQRHLGETHGKSRNDIEEILQRVREKGKARKYDCLVGLSGGRDSSYLLHQLVRKHELRCLAAYYRTPFTDDVIEENVQRIVSRLNVPMVRINNLQECHRKIARRVLLLWKKRRLPELTNLLCAPCKYINREVFEIARKNGIKSIIYGGNAFEVFQLSPAFITTKTRKHRHSFVSQVVKSLSIMKRGVSLLAKYPALLPLVPVGFEAAIFYINPHTPYLRMRYPDILGVDYFFHEEYDEAKCNDVVTSELGWQLPPAAIRIGVLIAPWRK